MHQYVFYSSKILPPERAKRTLASSKWMNNNFRHRSKTIPSTSSNWTKYSISWSRNDYNPSQVYKLGWDLKSSDLQQAATTTPTNNKLTSLFSSGSIHPKIILQSFISHVREQEWLLSMKLGMEHSIAAICSIPKFANNKMIVTMYAHTS